MGRVGALRKAKELKEKYGAAEKAATAKAKVSGEKSADGKIHSVAAATIEAAKKRAEKATKAAKAQEARRLKAIKKKLKVTMAQRKVKRDNNAAEVSKEHMAALRK